MRVLALPVTFGDPVRSASGSRFTGWHASLVRGLARRFPHALCLLALPFACARAEGDPRPAAEGPLVIELFTSQGCSSCPAADQLLSRVAAAGTLGDRTLAPLAFHVDYWNELGWADPYSLPAWTERQRLYARSIGDDRVYTPELVVGGAAGVIGSNLAAVTQAVQRAPHPAVLAATAAWDKATVTITATAPGDAEVWVAVWEDGTSTRVTRGENAGETLGGDRVVRRLERVAAAGQKASVTLKLDPRWRAGGAVAFAQRTDRRSREPGGGDPDGIAGGAGVLPRGIDRRIVASALLKR